MEVNKKRLSEIFGVSVRTIQISVSLLSPIFNLARLNMSDTDLRELRLTLRN